MQRWQPNWLGARKLPPNLTPFDLDQFFTVDEGAREVIDRRHRPVHRLGIALHIGFLRLSGRTLDAVQRIPRTVLRHLAEQLDIDAPDIASLRAIYRRRPTLFDHQNLAIEATGFCPLPEAAERGLTAHLRREATREFTVDLLVQSAQQWLYERHYLLLHRRRLHDLARAALSHAESTLRDEINRVVDESTQLGWIGALMAPAPRSDCSVLEWLQEPPAGRRKMHVDDHVAKRDQLVELGATKLTMESVSAARRFHYARRMMLRKPVAVKRIREPLRTIEIACFLRQQLLRVTEATAETAIRRIADLRRQARDRAVASETARLTAYQRFVADVEALQGDQSLSGDAMRDRLGKLLEPFVIDPPPASRTAAIRRELATMSAMVRPLLRAVSRLPIAAAPEHPLATALPILRGLYQQQRDRLPGDANAAFAGVWRSFIECDDRAAALRGFEAATLMSLQHSLRNGSAFINESLTFRNPDELFIPPKTWAKQRGDHYRRLSLPRSANPYLKRLRALLKAGLAQLDEVVREGVVTIERGRVSLGRMTRQERPIGLPTFRRRMIAALGSTQFPDLLLEIDDATRFSWILLGRPPRRERELVTVYAALIAHGSERTAADIVRMIPGLTEEMVAPVMRRLEHGEVVRDANDAVVSFMREHAIIRHWGQGIHASSDMMSLEASRHLWQSRIDPRRRTFAVGTYTHVLDQWGIVYDQPIVLNKWQAGAAIEGALRQRQVELERVAVDTHGFTHVAMAVAKLAGFDLCPRLAHIADRKLYVPKDMYVPRSLLPIVDRNVSWRPVTNQWDPLIRVTASIVSGWCPAGLALERFGSAAKGHPIHTAAENLGKLYRTVYLCDYFGIPAFKTEVFELLNQGESVHSLQRAIHLGPIGPRRGRSKEELVVISGSLTLLTNIVMAFNTRWMQKLIDVDPAFNDPGMLPYVAPAAFENINFKGVFAFGVERYRESLLGLAPAETAQSGHRF